MSIEGKRFYRFEYLKSEHWSNLRIAKLAEVDAVCRFCGKRDLANDVHHINYRHLYDVTLTDLVVLCRICHEVTHEALAQFDGQQEMATDKWSFTKKAVFALVNGLETLESREFCKWRKDEKRREEERKQEQMRLAQLRRLEKARKKAEALANRPPKIQTPADIKKQSRSRAMKHHPEVRWLFAELRKVGFFSP